MIRIRNSTTISIVYKYIGAKHRFLDNNLYNVLIKTTLNNIKMIFFLFYYACMLMEDKKPHTSKENPQEKRLHGLQFTLKRSYKIEIN